MLLWFDDNKIKMARKSGKKQKENLAGCNGDGKRRKGKVGSGEGETGTVLELSLEVRGPLCGWLSQGSVCLDSHISQYLAATNM